MSGGSGGVVVVELIICTCPAVREVEKYEVCAHNILYKHCLRFGLSSVSSVGSVGSFLHSLHAQ